MPNIDMGKIVAAGKRCGLTKAVLVEWAQMGTPRQLGFLSGYLDAVSAGLKSPQKVKAK